MHNLQFRIKQLKEEIARLDVIYGDLIEEGRSYEAEKIYDEIEGLRDRVHELEFRIRGMKLKSETKR